MEIKTVSCVSFSPTGTTRTIIEKIAQGMQAEQIEIMDCTNRSQRKGESFAFNNKDMVILGTPVYYGRVPEEVVPFFLQCQNTVGFYNYLNLGFFI